VEFGALAEGGLIEASTAYEFGFCGFEKVGKLSSSCLA